MVGHKEMARYGAARRDMSQSEKQDVHHFRKAGVEGSTPPGGFTELLSPKAFSLPPDGREHGPKPLAKTVFTVLGPNGKHAHAPTHQKTPFVRQHKASGKAIVTLDGRDHYLGEFGTPESRVEYDRLIHEWLANGRRLARPRPSHRLTRQSTSWSSHSGRPRSESTCGPMAQTPSNWITSAWRSVHSASSSGASMQGTSVPFVSRPFRNVSPIQAYADAR